MGAVDSYVVLMGIFRFSSQEDLPADSQAIQRTLFKLSKLFPDLLDGSLFDEEGFSQELDVDFDTIMLSGMLGMLGSKLEMLRIGSNLISEFDNRLASNFDNEQINQLRKMGKLFPKLLKKNESVRYKRLTK